MYSINDLKWQLNKLKTALYYRYLFGSLGANSTICKPMRLCNLKNVYIGKHFRLREFARLETIIDYDGKRFNPRLDIGDDVGIE